MFNFCKKPRTNCPINNSFTNFVRINNKHNNPALHDTSGQREKHEKAVIHFIHAVYKSVLCNSPVKNGRNKI